MFNKKIIKEYRYWKKIRVFWNNCKILFETYCLQGAGVKYEGLISIGRNRVEFIVNL